MKWLGAGVVTAGVVLAYGTGVAAAETRPGSDSAGTTSSQSADADDKTAGLDADAARASDLSRDDSHAADEDGADADIERGKLDTPPVEDSTRMSSPTTKLKIPALRSKKRT